MCCKSKGSVTLGQTLRIRPYFNTLTYKFLGLSLKNEGKIPDSDKKCPFFCHFKAKSQHFLDFNKLFDANFWLSSDYEKFKYPKLAKI